MKSLQCPRRRVRVEISNQYQSVAHLREKSGQSQAPWQQMAPASARQFWTTLLVSLVSAPTLRVAGQAGLSASLADYSLAMTLQILNAQGLLGAVAPKEGSPPGSTIANPTRLSAVSFVRAVSTEFGIGALHLCPDVQLACPKRAMTCRILCAVACSAANAQAPSSARKSAKHFSMPCHRRGPRSSRRVGHGDS